MPVDGSAVGTLCFVSINPSFVPSHTLCTHPLPCRAIAFAVVGVVRRLFISEVCGADRRSITQLPT